MGSCKMYISILKLSLKGLVSLLSELLGGSCF